MKGLIAIIGVVALVVTVLSLPIGIAMFAFHWSEGVVLASAVFNGVMWWLGCMVGGPVVAFISAAIVG